MQARIDLVIRCFSVIKHDRLLTYFKLLFDIVLKHNFCFPLIFNKQVFYNIVLFS